MKNEYYRHIKIIIVLLVICMMPLSSCKNKNQTSENEGNSTQMGNKVETSSSEGLFSQVYDDLPDTMDFNKQTIKVVIRENPRYSYEFLSNDSTGGIVSNAVFQRNNAVKQRLNTDVEYSTIDNAHGPWDAINVSINSGMCEYDVAIGSAAQATKFALNGSYRNLRKINNINLEKEYWSKGMVKNMTLADATYFATGSISTYFYDSAFVVYFNRDLCNDNGITPDSLYECVMSREWTLDKMISISKDIYVDDNGDSVANDGDVFGFGLQVTSATDGFFSSCDIPCTEVKDDGNLKYSIDIEKLDIVLTKLNNFLWESKGVVALAEAEKYASSDIYYFTNQFQNNKLLFVTDWLYSTSTSTMRNMESDFGVLPYPKYSERQDSYYTYAHDQMSVVGVPLTVNDSRIEMVGAFIEAMASSGHNIVLPTYYERALTGQYIRDPQSVKTMDIIVRNISNDRIWFLYYGAVTPLLRDKIWHNKSDLASTYSSNYNAVNLYLGSMRNAYAQYSDR